MTARIRCLLARCCLCLIVGGVIPRASSATQWIVPDNAKDRSDLLSSLLQGSEHIVLAKTDRTEDPDAPTIACTALEYLKGGPFPKDRFFYADFGDRPSPMGTYLLFLTRSTRYGLVPTRTPHRGHVTDDGQVVQLPRYSTSWPAYRDSIVNGLAALTPSNLARTADCAIRGTITTPSLIGSSQRKYGSLGIRVRTSYTALEALEPNSLILLDFPSPQDAYFAWWNLPPLTPDQDVILFLDRAQSEHFTLHGGLYGMWSVSGDSARVSCPAWHARGVLSILAVVPVDSLVAIINKR